MGRHRENAAMQNDINIEDNGALMTRSRRSVRIRRVLLILLAVIAVLAIVMAGLLLIGEKQYNEQIVIAEKALAESNYEQAEAGYLAAVNMRRRSVIKLRKRNINALEGLAYVYAAEKKVNESVTIYDQLYAETKEEKYIDASKEVSEGGLPSDPDIIPDVITDTSDTSARQETGQTDTGDNSGNDPDKNTGEYVMTSGATDGKTRDIALVLDTSGSMDGEPIHEVASAVSRFGDTVLGTTAKVGVISFSSQAEVMLPLSASNDQISKTAAELESFGGTNIGAGLIAASDMLSGSTADRKIVVLMTDGEPTDGMDTDELVQYAGRLREQGYLVYTLGFFSSMSPGSKSEPQRLLEHIASEGCHYEVSDASDLKFFFGDIADQINGVRYNYIRIACPVNVSVSYNGETLSSARTDSRARTSFGTLTFEDAYKGDDDYEGDGANAVKILRLLEGPDYEISIKGTGNGSMDYTIGFVDDNGEYSDMRYFDQIDISPRTEISTEARVSDVTKMTVDYDGNGIIDKTYKAKASSHAEIVDNTLTVKIVMIISAVIYALLLFLIIRSTVRRIRRNIRMM